MADMGFMPQVQKILYGIRVRAPDDALLGHARRRGEAPRRPLHERPGVARGRVDDEPTVDEMEHRFLAVHQMDKVKVAASIASGVNRTLVFVRTKRGADRLVHAARSARACSAAPIHGDLRQGARERALADFIAGKVPGARRHRRRRPRHPRRRRRRGRALRPARGRQGVPAPLRPHGPRRGERRRRHADAVEPGERGAGRSSAGSACRSRWSRCSPTTPASPTSPHWDPADADAVSA